MTYQERAMLIAKSIAQQPNPEKKREHQHLLCQYLIALLRGSV